MTEGIKLSDWVTEEEFNYHPRGELSAVIALAQDRREWFEKGIANEQERIIELWEQEMKCDCEDPMNHLAALIKGEK